MTENDGGNFSLNLFNGYVGKNKKNLENFILDMVEFKLIITSRKIGLSWKLPPCLVNQELDSGEIYWDVWESKQDELLLYVKNDVLSTTSAYAWNSEWMETITDFWTKISLILPSLANKKFNSLKNENDEPIYTYNDKYMRWFVRHAINGGRCIFLKTME